MRKENIFNAVDFFMKEGLSNVEAIHTALTNDGIKISEKTDTDLYIPCELMTPDDINILCILSRRYFLNFEIKAQLGFKGMRFVGVPIIHLSTMEFIGDHYNTREFDPIKNYPIK